MDAYEPLDLSAHCNVGISVKPTGRHVPEPQEIPIGRQTFHGLPFLIGPSQGDPECCFVGFGDQMRTEPLMIPINAPATRVIIAGIVLI